MHTSSRALKNLFRSMSSAPSTAPIETIVRSKLESVFTPSFFDVVNESYKHNVPKESESHFKVIVVSTAFEGKSLIQRHRLVNQALEKELKESIHALSIQARTPAQWEQDSTINNTPNCLGGDKK